MDKYLKPGFYSDFTGFYFFGVCDKINSERFVIKLILFLKKFLKDNC